MVNPHRKSNRLKNFDYSSSGWYFVTICTKNRECLFGEIVKEKMVLNKFGEVVKRCLLDILKHFPDVLLDEYVIMPNHIHAIVVIVGNKNFCSLHKNIPWQTKLSRSLSSVIRGFKIGVTKLCRKESVNIIIWQKSFYDHIILNEYSLNIIRQYIKNNQRNWADDRNNLINKSSLSSL